MIRAISLLEAARLSLSNMALMTTGEEHSCKNEEADKPEVLKNLDQVVMCLSKIAKNVYIAIQKSDVRSSTS